MNKVIRRIIGLIPAALIQFLWLFVLLRWLSPYAALINLLLSFFAVLYVLHIISNRNESTYKTLWLLVILGMSVFGTILYFCFGNKRTAKPLQRKLENGQALLPVAKGTVLDTTQELGRLNPPSDPDLPIHREQNRLPHPSVPGGQLLSSW